MDQIEIEILEDGKISIKTREISEKNHIDADELLELIEENMGGARQTEPLEHEFWKNRKVLRHGKIVKTSG